LGATRTARRGEHHEGRHRVNATGILAHAAEGVGCVGDHAVENIGILAGHAAVLELVGKDEQLVGAVRVELAREGLVVSDDGHEIGASECLEKGEEKVLARARLAVEQKRNAALGRGILENV